MAYEGFNRGKIIGGVKSFFKVEISLGIIGARGIEDFITEIFVFKDPLIC